MELVLSVSYNAQNTSDNDVDSCYVIVISCSLELFHIICTVQLGCLV